MNERVVAIASTTDIVLATMWRELLAGEGIHAELGDLTGLGAARVYCRCAAPRRPLTRIAR
jgi:hypothetical protein